MSLTSDEVNFLIFRYLQESGFVHSAFTFAHESLVANSSVASADVPPGALVSFIQKGLQYVEIETHLEEDGHERECDEPFSLLTPHVCKVHDVPVQVPPSDAGDDERMDGSAAGGGGGGGVKGATAVGAALAPVRDGADASTDGLGFVASGDVAVLTGHEAEVYICAWNPVDDILASGSADATARVWDVTGRDPTSVVLRHYSEGSDTPANSDVTTLEWNSSGSHLATGSYDGQARIWLGNKLVRTLSEHQGPVFSLRWNAAGTYLLSGSVDKTAIVWNADTGSVAQKFSFHTAPTLDVDWRNDTSFATCSTDKMVYVCEVGVDTPVATFEGHSDEVNAITWDPSGSLLASCSDDSVVKVWSVESGLVHSFTEHKLEVYTIEWSPGGVQPLTLASASFDSTVKLWDVAAGKCVHTLARHEGMVYTASFSPCGRYLASGSFDKYVHIWSTHDGRLLRSYKGGGSIFDASWNASGTKIAAVANKNVVVIDFRM